MSRSFLMFAAVVGLASSTGCGQGAAPSVGEDASVGAVVDTSSNTPDISSPAPDKTPSDPVARVVYEFLDAVRRGDTNGASVRLTPLALKRTTELDMNISPPGSDTAQFQVGATEMIDNDKAIVESTWSDQDADGQASNEQITWALKLSDGQWRISGMAAEIGSNQPPVIIDFENPEQAAPPAQAVAAPPSPAEEDAPRQATKPSHDPFR